MRKRRKGFTLIEIVVAVAALSLASGLIIQLFLAAMDINALARDIDTASNKAVTAIENIKALPEAPADGTVVTLFGPDWTANSGDKYELSVLTLSESLPGGQLVGITATVTRAGREESLIVYDAAKYFADDR